MALFWQIGDPLELRAICTRSQAEELAPYDHCRVIVNGRWGILMCRHWLPFEGAAEPFLLTLLLHPAPNYTQSEDQVRQVVQKHPEAPRDIQDLVKDLGFTPQSIRG